MSLQEIRIDLVGVGEILRSNKLSVPRFQRSYAWKDQNVIDLFQDIDTAIKEDVKEYFLGSIVISQNDATRPEVVDGQQRLATTAILLSAIRDYFYSIKDTERATKIQGDFLFETDLETIEKVPRLVLNDSDNEFFSKRILSLPDNVERQFQPTKDSHKRIERAACLAADFVRLCSSRNGEKNKKLIAIVKYVQEKTKVISVRVPDDANAFTIFETLNDRGLQLAISDLLKNYLFHLSGNRINEIQQWWISMIGKLEAVDKEEMLVTYIRHLWSSKYGTTREKELYVNIKKKVVSKKEAIEFAGELNDSAKYYAAMLNSNHEVWNEYGPTTREYMSTLNDLGVSQLRPLLLSLLDNFEIEELRKVIKLMVSWSVRFLITGGLGSGPLENQYCQRSVEIRKGQITTAKELNNAMRAIVPSDSEFKKAFEYASVSKEYLARYYLRAIERQIGGEKEPELVPNTNEDIITLEHILPENPSLAWGGIVPEVAKTYYKRIGNLTLLSKKINSTIGNNGFLAKCQYFKKSKFNITKSLASYGKWEISQIETRQKKLAENAVVTWPNKV